MGPSAASLLICLSFVLSTLAASTDSLPVTCGSTVKLMHVATGFRLHSHEVAYSRGSQQQSVTAYPTADDGNSLWSITGTLDTPCLPGSSIKKGSKLRLQHVGTRKWLHSHHFQSPLSAQMEVSAFGSDNESDTGDVWTVEWDGKHKTWKQDIKVMLKHQDTGGYLFSHPQRFGNPIAGQHEVCGVTRKDKQTEWQAAEGVYMPITTTSSKTSASDPDVAPEKEL
ncbi:hypothetical protein QJQ45_019127 [Haematococcus lacustris]|nr:hypothetical protein QJQ45_019127 [Haematococcus lacustris]